ncbi:MAG: hypothetical protein MUC97_17965 [Bernardetiaceae bacterium]|jgi:hypothetical protein|nr:hypothetical protein [Bernardetiaceae bacterium]
MKILAALAWLVVILQIGLGKIGEVNKTKREAETAFKNGYFEVASQRYGLLVNKLGVTEDPVRLNYAHALYKTRDTAQAINQYSALLKSPDREVRSVASQQLGVIRAMSKNYEQSLRHFRQSLRELPDNAEARYNYEVVRKLWQQRQKQQQQQQGEGKDQQNQQQQQKQQQNQQQNADQQQKQQQKQDQNDQPQKQGEQDDKNQETGKDSKDATTQKQSQRLQQMNMSKQQADNILEAMRNAEAQYLQQLQRKTSKRPEKGKPDW